MTENFYPKLTIADEQVISLKDSAGNTVDLVEYDGYYMSRNAIERGRIPDGRTNIPHIMGMKVRPDDVFLIAYPKAGTHWTNEIIHMLLLRNTEYHPEPKERFMLPFQTPERIDELPSPRIINSHMYFRHLPQDLLNKKNKIIFVNRNPKDVAVSFYHHCQNSSVSFQGSWPDFLDFFMSDIVYHCAWYKYMQDWEKVILEHPEIKVLFVNYEDLIKNTVQEIARMAEFLEVANTDEFYQNVADKCCFEELKQDYAIRYGPDGDNFMFRKGQVGGWKDCFTVAQNEQFDNYLLDRMHKSTWKFTYEI